MTDTKNFNCYKRLINRQLLQLSGVCGTPFFSYLPKRSTQIYRAQYGNGSKRIVKPSSQLGVDRVPYAVETPRRWTVTNWFPGEWQGASPNNAFKVYERSAGEDEELTRLVMTQSEIETLGVVKLANPTSSIEDKRALSLMERTTVKIDGEDAYV